MNFTCKIASLDEMEIKWNALINEYPNDQRWLVWKKEFEENTKNGQSISYYGFLGDKIICEATAMLDPEITNNGEYLVNEQMVYLCAFRTVEEYQNQGYFSKLFKFMCNDLKEKSYKKLSIGVEPNEVKNMKIYFNWGFENFIKTGFEEYPPENENEKGEIITVNYYYKDI